MLESVLQDIRYAARGLRKQPGFTVAAVVTLALGIGANAAMFGVTDRLLFRPPAHMTDADRVHRVYLVQMYDGEENFQSHLQYTRFKDLERWTSSFDAVSAYTLTNIAVGVGTDAQEMWVGAVSASHWSLFDVRLPLGRTFTAAEDTTPSGADVAVLSHAFWQSRFGGKADALGQQVRIGNRDYSVIGVLPEGFSGMATGQVPAAWIPITTYAADQLSFIPNDPHNWFQKYNIVWMQMLARRKAGVSVEAASADLSNAFRRSYDAQRELSPRLTLPEIAKPRAIAGSLFEARGPQPSETSKVAQWVWGVAIVVMLIACANVANLLLARALRRRREIAVRLALGVSRARLTTQLLIESLILAALGCAAGLLLAQWGGSVLRAQFLPSSEGSIVDVRTMLFAAICLLFVGLVTGLAPALHAGRGSLTSDLKSGAREGTYRRSKTRIALLVTQGALSVVLLVGAGLFVRSLSNVMGMRLGYDVDRLLWVSVNERGENLTDAEKSGLRNRLAEEARRIPGVANATRAIAVPFYISWNESIVVEGIDSATMTKLEPFNAQAVSPEYMATLGTRIIRGRNIEPTDTKDAPKVMVVSESMTRSLWPGKDPLGQCVRFGQDTMPCTTVVGVAEDIRTTSEWTEDNRHFHYRPIEQVRETRGGLFVRTRGDAEMASEAVRRALQQHMPGASYVTVQPMNDIFGPAIRSWRLGATMFVTFGGLALLLAAVGLYSVIAYNVAQRTHELGVRVAFGAEARDLVRLVFREGMQLTVAGIAIGGVIALLAGRWVAPLLYDVSPTDPAVFSLVGVTLLVVAAVASSVPALRASRVDPNVALRSE